MSSSRGVSGGSLRILLKAEPLAPPPRSNVLTVAVLSTPGSAGKAAGWAVRSGAGRAACQPAGPARAGVAEADTAGTDRRGRQRSGHARPDLREPAGSAVGQGGGIAAAQIRGTGPGGRNCGVPRCGSVRRREPRQCQLSERQRAAEHLIPEPQPARSGWPRRLICSAHRLNHSSRHDRQQAVAASRNLRESHYWCPPTGTQLSVSKDSSTSASRQVWWPHRLL